VPVLDSILLYAGAATTAVSAVRRSKRGAAAGVAMMAIALAWPATEQRIAAKTMKLDDAMPEWQFNEVHAIDVAAPPEKVFEAIRAVTADEIFLFRTLTAIRRGGFSGRESIINAPKNQPLLDVATRSGFHYVADDPPHELVFDVVIERPNVTMAAMNFHVVPTANGSRLTTETRVHSTTAAAARRFAIYWRVVQPGSDIIRRSWLRAIKRRAEVSFAAHAASISAGSDPSRRPSRPSPPVH